MAKKINGYTVEFIGEYREIMVADAVQNALGAELAGMPETADFGIFWLMSIKKKQMKKSHLK